MIKKKRLLSLLLAMAMIFSTMAFPAFAADGHCDDEANCLVCNVADLINALPVAEEITAQNAAAVTDQIHAIDRSKFDLTDDQYDELLTLVETSETLGLGVPARYVNAVNAVKKLTGAKLEISKEFLSSEGNVIDVSDAEVVIKVTNVDTDYAQTLTLATMPEQLGTLSADAEFYTMNENADGWTYKYVLPAGTYHVEEVSDSGAKVNGEDFVTTQIAYDGVVSKNGTIVTLSGDGVVTLPLANGYYPKYNFNAIDEEGNVVEGVSMTLSGTYIDEENQEVTWTTSAENQSYELSDSCKEYILTVNSVPDGYIMPENTVCTFSFSAGGSLNEEMQSPFSWEPAEDSISYNLFISLEKDEEAANKIPHTIKAVSAADPDVAVEASYIVHDVCCEDTTIASGSVTENTTVDLKENHEYRVEFALEDGERYDDTLWRSDIVFTAGMEEDVYQGDYNEIHYNSQTDTITVAYAPFEGIPTGEASVTVNFKDREGNPMKVLTNVGYMYYDYYEEYSRRSIYEMTELADSITLTGLGDGEYEIGAILEIEEEKQGYNINTGYCAFWIENGKLVGETEYDEETGERSNGISCANGTVSNIDVESGSFDLTVASHTVGGMVKVPGFINGLAWEIKNAEGEVVLSSSTTDNGFLDLGTYTFNVVEEEDLSEVVKYPETGISFTVKETAVDWNNQYCDYENGEVEWYPVLEESDYDIGIYDDGNTRFIEWNLEATETVDVNIKLSTSDGSNFDSGVIVKVVYDNEDEETITVFEEEISTEINTFEKTVTAATKSAVWNEPDESETEGYYTFVANAYRVEGIDQFGNEIHFVKNSDGVWEATVAGVDAEVYSIYNDYNFEGGTVEANKYSAAVGETVTLTAEPDAGYELSALTVTSESDDTVVYQYPALTRGLVSDHAFEMPADNVKVDATFTHTGVYYITLPEYTQGGSASADKSSAAVGETITVTVTPDEGCQVDVFVVTADTTYDDIEYTQVSDGVYTFTMPADDVHVGIAFGESTVDDGGEVEPEPDFETPFTVTATVANTSEDVDTSDADMDVYVNDNVVVEVKVNGDDFTNADWTMLYDSSKFELVSEELHTDAVKVTTGSNLLAGKLVAPAGKVDGDEYAAGTVVATYTFKALSQSKEVTGRFAITAAHANNYDMAAELDNCPANVDGVDVTILLVDDDAQLTKPSGTIEAKTTTYNGLLQTGNEFVLDEEFADATVTYFAYTDGSEIADGDGDGEITAADVAGLAFRTTLPAWQNVGTYNYYVKITGDGLAETIVSTTLTINPKPVTPTVVFEVDPDVNKVKLTPVIEGVYDETYIGNVTVTFNGQDYTFEASEFVYDGESSAVSTRSEEIAVPTSGEFTATVKYTSGTDETTGAVDNYADGEGEAKVDVDKISASTDTADALEDAITSEFVYDGTEHGVVIDTDAIDAIAETPDGDWIASIPVDAYDNSEKPTVKNVGDEKLVKVVFNDNNGIYNDITVYVVLKVTPAEVTITVDDKSKGVGANDPELTGTIEGLVAGEENILDVKYERQPGETAGTYPITASYVPNDNYVVTVVDGELTIGELEIGLEVFIEVVDMSLESPDAQPDYIANKRLILVYTNADKAYYSYDDEKMFDVTARGYHYVENDYSTGTLTAIPNNTDEFAHVYGIVVDSIGTYEATEDYEKKYRDMVKWRGSDAEWMPDDITYNADINLSETEIDINDYSMTNGIYNVMYDRVGYMISILKADTNGDKRVDTDDAYDIKADVEAKN